MLGRRDDDVIEHFDLEQLARSNQVARHFDVRFAGRRVPRRMIVHQHEGGRCGRNRDPEHLSWMHEDGIEGAVTDEVMAANPPAGVEQQHDEAFAFWIIRGRGRDVGTPILGGEFWRVAHLHVFRQGTVAQGDQLPFLGMI